jgi:hypothetical protein
MMDGKNENVSSNRKTPQNMFDMKDYAMLKDDMADLKSVADASHQYQTDSRLINIGHNLDNSHERVLQYG